MKMISRSTVFALLGCAACISLSSAAQAARFQQYLNGACVGLVCTINFSVVPAGKTLDVSNFSCYLRVSGVDSGKSDVFALQLLQIKAGGGIGNAVTADLQFVDSITTPSERVYQSNNTIFAFATAGQRFRAYAELKAGTFSQFACHISGQLLP